MRRLQILAIVLFVVGCSSRSSLPTPPGHYEVTPQVFQGSGNGQSWAIIKLFGGSVKGSADNGIVADSHGVVWVGAKTSGGPYDIVSVNMFGAVHAYPLTTGKAFSLTIGPDHNLWFVGDRWVGTMTPTGLVTTWQVIENPENDTLDNIVSGSDGALWFTEGAEPSVIGRITTSGSYSTFAMPANTGPGGLTAGPDGNLWISASDGSGNNEMIRMTTSGTMTSFPVTGEPGRSTVGPDRAIWFVEAFPVCLGRITTLGVVTEYPYTASRGLDSLAITSDGTVWMETSTQDLDPEIVSFTPSTDTWSTPLPFPKKTTGYSTMIVGPDGNIWGPTNTGTFLTIGNATVYLRQSMTVNPSPLTIAAPGLQSNLTVAETNYSGNWSGSSNNKAVATIARGTVEGTLVVTAHGAGSCVLTIGDADHNTVRVNVTVQ